MVKEKFRGEENNKERGKGCKKEAGKGRCKKYVRQRSGQGRQADKHGKEEKRGWDNNIMKGRRRNYIG